MIHVPCPVGVTIFSAGGNIRLVSNFTKLHALILAACSYALLLLLLHHTRTAVELSSLPGPSENQKMTWSHFPHVLSQHYVAKTSDYLPYMRPFGSQLLLIMAVQSPFGSQLLFIRWYRVCEKTLPRSD